MIRNGKKSFWCVPFLISKESLKKMREYKNFIFKRLKRRRGEILQSFFHKKEAKVEFRRCLTSERDREKEEVRARDREKTRREKGKKGGGGVSIRECIMKETTWRRGDA